MESQHCIQGINFGEIIYNDPGLPTRMEDLPFIMYHVYTHLHFPTFFPLTFLSPFSPSYFFMFLQNHRQHTTDLVLAVSFDSPISVKLKIGSLPFTDYHSPSFAVESNRSTCVVVNCLLEFVCSPSISFAEVAGKPTMTNKRTESRLWAEGRSPWVL